MGRFCYIRLGLGAYLILFSAFIQKALLLAAMLIASFFYIF